MKPFFWTKNKNEAERLIPILAKSYGGKKCFTVQDADRTLASARGFCICYDAKNQTSVFKRRFGIYNHRRKVDDLCVKMSGVLLGYLAAEKNAKLSAKRLTKMRANRRLGRPQ